MSPDAARRHFQEELRGLEVAALGAFDLVAGAMDRTLDVAVLERLERAVHRAGDQVERAEGRHLEALEHRDIELAAMIVADDDRLDGRYLEVHQTILSLLALQAPVASDLRLLAALMHVIKYAERMGDQCVNIAKILPLDGTEPPIDDGILGCILEMGRLAKSEVVQAKAAFERRDVDLAHDLVRQDAQVNRLQREVFKQAIEAGVDHDRREWAMHMVIVARCLERIGDNAVDVGEQVAFMVTGLFREFSDSSHPAGVVG